jgi:hypothetical protein
MELGSIFKSISARIHHAGSKHKKCQTHHRLPFARFLIVFMGGYNIHAKAGRPDSTVRNLHNMLKITGNDLHES